jgi:hypothetical protein
VVDSPSGLATQGPALTTFERWREEARARGLAFPHPCSGGLVVDLFLASRIAIWLGAAFAFLWFEPNRQPRAFRWDSPVMHELGWFSDLWARWDSGWLLGIAEHGYNRAAAAFPPLYPATISVVGHAFGGHYVLAGTAVSLAAGYGSFRLLHTVAAERLDEAGARRAVLYLAVFPMTLFLQAVYSESVYLLFALWAFTLAERRRYASAGLVAGLAMLTRSVGIVLLPALALLAWRDQQRRRALIGLSAAIPVAAIYPLVLWAKLGDPWAFQSAEDHWHRHPSTAGPLGGIWYGLRAAWDGVRNITGKTPLHPAAVNLEDFAFLVLFLALTVVAWHRFGAPYGLFAALSLAIPLSVPSTPTPLLSLPRFGLVIFPLFLALASLDCRPRVNASILGVSTFLLGIAVVQWALWQWVA